MIEQKFTVTSLDANQRIDKYLRKILPKAPLSFIYTLIRKKDVKVNGVRIKGEYIIKIDDEIVLYLTKKQHNDFIEPYHFEQVVQQPKIVYEDENIVVVNKPQGMPVHQTMIKNTLTLVNIVLSYLFSKGEFNPDNRGYIPSPISRIDLETDGIVVFAKSQIAHQLLAEAFTSPENIVRRYLLVIHGILHGGGLFDDKLAKNARQTTISEEGKTALTKYHVLKTGKTKTLVEAWLLTGRSNQIRVHFSANGYPIVGDRKYGIKDDAPYLALNAISLMFKTLPPPLSYLNSKEFIADNSDKFDSLMKEE